MKNQTNEEAHANGAAAYFFIVLRNLCCRNCNCFLISNDIIFC